MRKTTPAILVPTITAVVCLLMLSSLAYAAPPASTQKSASPVQAAPSAASRTLDRNAPPQGTITITSPASGETWRPGDRKEIQWNCTGSCSLVDVTLWMGGVKTYVVGTAIGSGRTSYTVPTYAAAGSYELRVTSEYDTGVEAKQTVSVSLGSITITAPKQNEQVSTNAKYTITWTYTGNPGSVSVHYKESDGKLYNIAKSVAGTMGQGSVVWDISDDQLFNSSNSAGAYYMLPRSYYVVVKSIGNPAISATSSLFNIVCQKTFCKGMYGWNACVDLNTDKDNCGGCHHLCRSAATCVNGSCVCSSPNVTCGNVCVNLNYDNGNCGTCGKKCAPEKGVTCVQGACVVTDQQKNENFKSSIGQ